MVQVGNLPIWRYKNTSSIHQHHTLGEGDKV